MKTHLAWGAVLALASAALTLVLYLSGFQTTRLETGQYLQWLGFPLMIAVLALGARAVAVARTPQGTGYGRALGSIVLIALFGGLLSGIYTFLHFQFINPDFPDYVAALTESRLESMGLPPEQIENALTIQRTLVKPPIQAVMAFVGQLFFGTLFGLLIAVFVRRPAEEPPVVPSGGT